MRNFEADLELARQDNEDLEEAKENLEKDLAKAKNEVSMWKRKFEEEGQAKAEELEVARYDQSSSKDTAPIGFLFELPVWTLFVFN